MAKEGVSKKNEALLRAYLGRNGTVNEKPGPVKKGKGRPVIRTNRPKRSAAKRTNEGEERYTITVKTSSLNKMKLKAKKQGLLIKDAFDQAIENYLII